jgi:hypothetical protein
MTMSRRWKKAIIAVILFEVIPFVAYLTLPRGQWDGAFVGAMLGGMTAALIKLIQQGTR